MYYNTVNENDIFDREFLYNISFSDVFTKNEQENIRLELTRYGIDLNESFFSSIKKFGSNISSRVKDTLSSIKQYVTKYINLILEHITATYSVFGDKNDAYTKTMAKTFYTRNLDQVNELTLKSINKQEELWYTNTYNFFVNVYNKIIQTVKELLIKRTKTELQESLLLYNSEVLFEDKTSMLDDKLNNFLSKLTDITKWIDNKISKTYTPVLKMLSPATTKSLTILASSIESVGGPKAPANSFKTTLPLYQYFMVYKYTNLTKYVSSYTNTKLFVKTRALSLLKKGAGFAMPSFFILDAMVGFINRFNMFRHLIILIRKHKISKSLK